MEHTVNHLHEDLHGYMRLEDSGGIIQSMIDKTVKAVKKEIKFKADENYEKIYKKIEDQNKSTADLKQMVEQKFDHLKSLNKESTHSQDDVIDLITCELVLESKKKSDLYLELSTLKDLAHQQKAELQTKFDISQQSYEYLREEFVSFRTLIN